MRITEEIASELGISERQVYRRLKRGCPTARGLYRRILGSRMGFKLDQGTACDRLEKLASDVYVVDPAFSGRLLGIKRQLEGFGEPERDSGYFSVLQGQTLVSAV